MMISRFFKPQTFLYLLIAFAVLLPFRMQYTNILLILLFVFALAYRILHYRNLSVEGEKVYFGLPLILFALQIIGLLFIDDIKTGLSFTERRLPLLLFPLVFFWGPQVGKNGFHKIMCGFLSGLSLCIFYCVANAIKLDMGDTAFEGIQWRYFSDWLFDPVGINHLTYGIYSAFGLSYMAHSILETRKGFGLSLNLLFFLIIPSGLVLVMPKMAILSLIMSLCAVALMHRKNIKRSHVLASFFAFVVIAVAIFYFLPQSRGRIMQLGDGYSRDQMINDQYNYAATRTGAFYCSTDLIKENWLWGLGTGMLQKNMDACFESNKVGNLKGLDTHNQYFDYLLSYGVCGLVIFAFFLLYPLWYAIQMSHKEFVFLLIILLISFLTENYLNYNKGIMFIAFFYNLLSRRLSEGEKYESE